MLIDKGYYLGLLQGKFILWNNKYLKYIEAKNFGEAFKMSKEIIKNME